MKRWYETLPDWRTALTWLVLTFLAALIYFSPVARLIDSLAD
jgi:hypothetical protein